MERTAAGLVGAAVVVDVLLLLCCGFWKLLLSGGLGELLFCCWPLPPGFLVVATVLIKVTFVGSVAPMSLLFLFASPFVA